MPGAGGPFRMAAHVRTVQVPEADRRVLERRARDKGAPARVVERARIVLLAADEVPGKQIAAMVGCAEGTVVTWRGRYAERGLAGLADLPRSGKPSPLPEGLRDRVLQLTLTEPPTALGATHWSSRLLATALAAQGTPSRTPPSPESGTASGCGPGGRRRSSSPPIRPWRARSATSSGCICIRRRRRWCCVDEKPQIPSLQRTAPTLPVPPGHPEPASFDYLRHGTTTLFAALEVATGRVTEACTERHPPQELLGFLKQVAAAYPGGGRHVVVDNLSTHKPPTVQTWLARRPRVT